MSEWWLAWHGGRSATPTTLHKVAALAYGYSDQVALMDDQTVVLEVSRSQRLHGPPPVLAQALRAEIDCLPSLSHAASALGAASNASAAAALARFDQQVWPGQCCLPALHRLPLSGSPIPTSSLQALQACGVKTLGELIALPRAECNRRFGPALGHWLDQLRGRQTQALRCWQPDPKYYQRIELPYASHCKQRLQGHILQAITPMWQWLNQRGLALASLRLRLYSEARLPPHVLDIGLAKASLDVSHFSDLLHLKLDQCQLSAAVQVVVVQLQDSPLHEAKQVDAWAPGVSSQDWAALIDRLRARLGQDQITGLSTVSDHRPEYAWSWHSSCGTQDKCPMPPRPSWLLPQPQPCQRQHLQLIQGPERIESGWWEVPDRQCRRDYYVATDPQGRRLWVYCQADDRRWFIHGLFG